MFTVTASVGPFSNTFIMVTAQSHLGLNGFSTIIKVSHVGSQEGCPLDAISMKKDRQSF